MMLCLLHIGTDNYAQLYRKILHYLKLKERVSIIMKRTVYMTTRASRRGDGRGILSKIDVEDTLQMDLRHGHDVTHGLRTLEPWHNVTLIETIWLNFCTFLLFLLCIHYYTYWLYITVMMAELAKLSKDSGLIPLYGSTSVHFYCFYYASSANCYDGRTRKIK